MLYWKKKPEGVFKIKTFNEKSRESYNLIADNYDNTLEGKYTEKFKLFLLEEISIQSGESILDVACGNGKLLNLISKNHTVNCSGIDISENMIENAKVRCPHMHFEVSECEKTSFRDNTFDIITVCAAYHHFPDVKAFAKEINRILKPRGRLYIAEVYYPAVIRSILNPFVPLSKAGDVKFYSPEEIVRNFEAHGLSQIKTKIQEHIQIIGMKK